MSMNNSIVDAQGTMNARSKKSIRQLRGWIAICGWCHQLVMWEALGIFWNVWSLQQQLAERNFLAVVIAFSAFASLVSSIALLNNEQPSKATARVIAPSMPRLRLTAVMSGLTVVVMAIEWAISAHTGSGRLSLLSSTSASYVAQTAQYLGHLWRTTAIGLILVVASLLVQPSAVELKPYEKLLVIGSDICIVLLFLLLKNIIAVIGLIFLHITIANVLLSRALGQPDEHEPQNDEGWGETHQESL